MLALCCIGGGFFLARDFVHFEIRSKQAACKTTLVAIYRAQLSYRAEHNAWAATFAQLGFEPERGNRYAYFIGSSGHTELRRQAKIALGAADDAVGVDVFKFGPHSVDHEVTLDYLDPRVNVGEHDGAFVAACVGNIDFDPTLDTWAISTESTKGPDGKLFAAGTPINYIDDVRL